MSTAKQHTSAWEEAKREGIDVTLLEWNLKKTPTERVRYMQSAIDLAEKLKEAGRRYYAQRKKCIKLR